jgi:hypothetical protein
MLRLGKQTSWWSKQNVIFAKTFFASSIKTAPFRLFVKMSLATIFPKLRNEISLQTLQQYLKMIILHRKILV